MKNTFAYLTKEQYNGIDRFQENEYGVDNKTICFIADTNEIYTHGKPFGKGGNGNIDIDGLTINITQEDGNSVINPTNLPKAGVNKLGILGLKMGGGVKIDNNTMIYVDPAETLQTIKNYINEHPTTEVPLTPATKTKLGGVIVGDGLSVASNGKISANVQEIKNMFTDAGITFNGASKLSDLEDVDGTPVRGQVLKWNGSKWAPALDETSTGEGGTPSQYVVGWSDDGDDVTFADNKNNTVTISKSGSNTPNEFDIDEVNFDLTLGSDNILQIEVNGWNRGDGVDLSNLVGSLDIPLADSDTVGGMKALSYSEGSGNSIYTDAVNAFGQWIDGPSSWFNMGYLSDEGSGVTVFPLIVDRSQGYGLIAIPNDLFGDGTGGTTVVANPGGDPEDALTTIKIGTKDYKIVGGNGGGTTVVANPSGTDGSDLTRIKIGSTNYNIPTGNSYTLPKASSTVLGGIKVGSGLAIDELSGVLSCTVVPGEGGLTNAFSRVTVGNTNIDASGSDSFSLIAGTNVTLTPNATNKTITINATGGEGGTTYIENPYDDSWKTAALNRITAAENSLNSIHNWTENEINALAKTQVDTYKTKIDDVGRWIMTGDLDDELADRFVTLGYTSDETVAWSTLSQKVDLIEASVNSVTQTENNHYTALNSSLNTQITEINGLKTSVASLGTSYATLNEDADALSWLASYYNSMTDQTKTMAQVFSDVQTAAGLAATAAVQTQINTLDGRVTSAETSLASMVTDVNGLKSNSAGYLTESTLDGAVATMFANSNDGTAGSGKSKVTAFIEARVGDMVSDAAQGNGALSELVLSADQIKLDANTTIANALTANYILSKVNGSEYIYVKGIKQNNVTPYTTINKFGITFNNVTGDGTPSFSSTDIYHPRLGYSDIVLAPTADQLGNTTGILINAKGGSNVNEYEAEARLITGGRGMLRINDEGLWSYAFSNAKISDYGAGNNDGSLNFSLTSSGLSFGKPGEAYYTTGTSYCTSYARIGEDLYLSESGTSTIPNLTVTGTFLNTTSGSGSDIRYKNIVDDVHMDIADIAAAPKFTYTNKDDLSGKTYVGTSAQYWQDVLPESVIADENGRLYMQYGNAALVAAISVAEEVVALKNEIAELKQQIAALTSNN